MDPRFSLAPFGLLAALAAAGSRPQGTPPPKTARPAARPSPRPTPTPSPLLEGIVQGPQGKPVEGALVSARPALDRWTDDTRTTRTDSAGRFRLALVSGNPHDVLVEAKGLAPQKLEKTRPGSPLVVRLEMGRAIEGVVRDETGQPVAGVRLAALGAHGLPTSAWRAEAPANDAFSDERGRFQIVGIGPGLHNVMAVARGYSRAWRRSVRPGASLAITLRRGGWIEGVVSDPDGRPVSGAQVRAELEPRFWDPARPERTDAAGRFEVPGLAAGRYTLVASHPDFAPVLATSVAVGEDGPSATSLAFSRHATLVGRLVDEEGQGVRARMQVQEASGRELPRSLSELMKGASGPDGRFRLDRVGIGSWTFGATAQGFAGQRIEASVSGRQEIVDLGDILLERGLTMRGRVRTESGEPVAQAQIDAFQRDAMRGGAMVEAQSGEDGSFLLAGLSPGAYNVHVRADGFAWLTKGFPAGSDNVDIVLSPGGAISGVVVGEGDRPVDSFEVTASPDAAGERRFEGRASDSVGSADGRFRLENVAEGTYVLEVVAPERAPATVSGLKVVPGRTADAGTIRLRPGGVVRGSVLDAEGGPVAGAQVLVLGPGTDRIEWMGLLTADSDPAGGFEIRGVPEGSNTVGASHADFAPGETAVTVEPAKGPADVQITLFHGGRIEGQARKREGTPLAGLHVRAGLRILRGPSGFQRLNAMTRADGSFDLEHVPAGTVILSLMADGGAGRSIGVLSKTVDVREGETATADFVSREILVTGRVTCAGAPLAGVDLRLWSQSGTSMMVYGPSRGAPAPSDGPERMHAVTREDGAFELLVDEPGKFTVSARSVDDSVSYPARSLEIPDLDTHAVELAFSGVPVTGVVVDEATEQPVPGTSVSARPSDPGAREGAAGAQTRPDGRFSLDLDPGDYVLSARSDRYAEASLEVSIGASGASDLRFELLPGKEISGRIVDATGRGVGGLVAFATSEDEQAPGYTRTLADGSFRYGSLGDKPYNICGGNEQAGFAVGANILAGRKDVALTLQAAGHVRLLVRGPDGVPVTQAHASVSRVGSARVFVPMMGSGGTNPSGVAEFPTPAGTLEISVRGQTHKATLRLSVASGATVDAEVTLTEPLEGGS